MLIAKNSLYILIKGSLLSAAFSFVFFTFPAVGAIFHSLSLAPLFYVGIRLGDVRLFGVASTLPFIIMTAYLGIKGGAVFMLTNIMPAAIIVHLHTLKKGRAFAYSKAAILDNFCKLFLAVIIAITAYSYLTKTNILRAFGISSEIIELISKKAPNFENYVEMIPGIFCVATMMVIWNNYQLGYYYAIKVGKIRNTDKYISNLPHFWDLVMVGGLWIYLLQKILFPNVLLSILSKAIICVALFPITIEGIEIVRLLAKIYKIPNFVYFFALIFAFLLVWPIIFIVALGLIGPWYGLKYRCIKKLGA